MNKTVTAIFDGQVLRPDTPLELEPNLRYAIMIESALPSETLRDAWDVLEALAGTVEAPQDWASDHDHYLYGTPKRHLDTTL